MISFVGMILVSITIVLFILYGSLMTYYWLSWNSFPDYSSSDQSATTKFSIVIPARNEEQNIGELLKALENQSYSKEMFEVIVVDDHSTDKTADVVRQYRNVRLVSLIDKTANSYKKKAIGEGISVAKNDFIITTDADCKPSPQWLKTMAGFLQDRKSVFVAGPVAYEFSENSLLSFFQSLDFLVLQGITMVSVEKNLFSMCNGANIGYERKAFFETGGFNAIDHIASGDDMLLMQKINKQHPGKVHYLKSKLAVVNTAPANGWKNFFNQRLRWASKARYYEEPGIFWVQLLVYLFNFLFIVLLIAAIWNIKFLFLFPALWFAKTIIEFPFVYAVASWFGRRSLMKWFLFFQPLHILYTVVVGLMAQFVKYEWKGRMTR